MYSPGYPLTIPPMVSVFTKGIGWMAEDVAATQPQSAVFEAANDAVYAALLLPAACVVRRLWWANGATVSASYNVDVGIYAASAYGPGARLVSTGSTAQGTASEVQFVNVTDTALAPGLYWLALACSSASATFFRSAVTGRDASFRFSEASALPLPATATPVESTGTNIYLYGFATTP
jgi:hypothetical protein